MIVVSINFPRSWRPGGIGHRAHEPGCSRDGGLRQRAFAGARGCREHEDAAVAAAAGRVIRCLGLLTNALKLALMSTTRTATSLSATLELVVLISRFISCSRKSNFRPTGSHAEGV
jgi:hypothetical protein